MSGILRRVVSRRAERKDEMLSHGGEAHLGRTLARHSAHHGPGQGCGISSCLDALSHDGWVAEAETSLADSFVRAHPLGEVVFGAPAHVFAQLVFNFEVEARAPTETPNSGR